MNLGLGASGGVAAADARSVGRLDEYHTLPTSRSRYFAEPFVGSARLGTSGSSRME